MLNYNIYTMKTIHRGNLSISKEGKLYTQAQRLISSFAPPATGLSKESLLRGSKPSPYIGCGQSLLFCSGHTSSICWPPLSSGRHGELDQEQDEYGWCRKRVGENAGLGGPSMERGRRAASYQVLWI